MTTCSVAILVALEVAQTCGPLPTRFHFLPLEPDKTLSVKHEGTAGNRPERWKARMVVDEVLTDGRWPEHPPTVYRIGKQAYYLDDSYSGAGDFIWDGATKTLTQIGRCYLSRVPGLGTLVLRRHFDRTPAVEVLDFPTEDGKPRVLWRSAEASVAPLGVWDGALVLVQGGKRLAVLEPNWPAKELNIDTGNYSWQANGVSIRRGKALLLGDGKPPLKMGQGEYTVGVAVLNLKTREMKPIGRIEGSWTINTAVPHPVVSAQWITPAEADKLPKGVLGGGKLAGLGGYGGWFVNEETDQIVR